MFSLVNSLELLILSYARYAQGINILVDFFYCVRVTEALLPSLAVGKPYHYLHKNQHI